MRRLAFIFVLLAIVTGLTSTSWAGSPNAGLPSPTPDPVPASSIGSPAMMDSLLNLMVSKGVLTTAEAVQLRGLPAGQQVTPLLSILVKKGVLSKEELAALTSPVPAPLVVSGAVAETPAAQAPAAPKSPAAPPVIAAVAPLRVLPVDAPKKDGLIPDFKIGPVKVKPYGMIKASAIYDSASPR